MRDAPIIISIIFIILTGTLYSQKLELTINPYNQWRHSSVSEVENVSLESPKYRLNASFSLAYSINNNYKVSLSSYFSNFYSNIEVIEENNGEILQLRNIMYAIYGLRSMRFKAFDLQFGLGINHRRLSEGRFALSGQPPNLDYRYAEFHQNTFGGSVFLNLNYDLPYNFYLSLSSSYHVFKNKPQSILLFSIGAGIKF